jgi:hypothetical protein
VLLLLKTAQETVEVQLGPSDYVDQQGLGLAAGNQVQVKGSRLTRAKKTFIVAAEVRKGDKVLRLRDETGRPMWARSRRPR